MAEPTENEPDSDSSPRPSIPFVRDAGIAGGAVVLFLLVRIMAIAHWDWPVASDVADSINFSDAVGAVLGTLFARPTVTAIVIMFILPLSVVEFVWCLLDKNPRIIGRVLFVVFLGTATTALILTFHMWWLLIGATALGAVLTLMRIFWKHGYRRQSIVGLLRATGVLAIIAALAMSTLIDTPWMLHEQIETDQETLDGYVIETPSGFLKVLVDDPREVRILNSSDVVSRVIIDE